MSDGPRVMDLSKPLYDEDAEDPLTKERGRCLMSDCHVRKYYLELKECHERVLRKIKYTAETCEQEICDLMMALDHCVDKKAFLKLK